MAGVSAISVSHQTAPVEVRELFSLPAEMARRLLRELAAEAVLDEAMVLDTCNRTEVYFVCPDKVDCPSYLIGHIARLKGVAQAGGHSAFRRLDGLAAVNHLFRVASGLESQVLGEDQILGQVKAAYRLAVEERMARFHLNKLLHWAFRVGKRVRSQTELNRGSASVAQAGVELACRLFTSLAGKSALLIGAGEMGRLTARALIRHDVGRIVVANRSLAGAEEVAAELLAPDADPDAPVAPAGEADSETGDSGQARFVLPGSDDGAGPTKRVPATQSHGAGHGDLPGAMTRPARPARQAIALQALPAALAEADLVICATASPEHVLTFESVGEPLRQSGRPIFIIDLGMPRNVDPRLGQLSNVYLFNMNDLDAIVGRNVARRRKEIPRAEAIIADELARHRQWLESLAVEPTVRQLQDRFNVLLESALKKFSAGCGREDRDRLEQFARHLCNKILHHPITFLRLWPGPGGPAGRNEAAAIIRRMFELDAPE